MKKFITAILCLLISLSTREINAQTAAQPRWNVASWEPGLGMVFRHQEKFSAARLQLGTRNLFIKNRVGIYYILEYRGGIQFKEDGTSFYFRDLLGLNYSVNKSFSIHGGLGVFRKGLLQSGENRGGEYFYNNIQFGRLRKEIGVTYRIPQYPVSVDICYSTWVGPTATFGYIIPMKQKKLGNAPLKSIPMYDVPVIVETKPEPEAPVKTIDTVVEKPIYVETKPTIDTVVEKPVYVETKPTIDTVVEKPVYVETKPEVVEPSVDLKALAKQSTTYYPFNVDTLNVANQENLVALVQYMTENAKCKAIIYGNADRLGSESYNLTLSASRAKKLKVYLVSQGIAASRIKVVAYGETKAKGETEEERALNRCVEFNLSAE
ncbi:MAG: OmpA family protein [Bacteroidetes bacterium]|nr:OmpA family protein [Bacteroidota bacterium]